MAPEAYPQAFPALRPYATMRGQRRAQGARRRHAPVAQPDRVVASEAIGRGFESLRARQRIVPVRQCRVQGWTVRNYDLDFLKKFSLVIGFLALVTLGLILLARYINGVLPQEVDPSIAARTEARIAPVGGVYAGATGAAAQAAAAAAAREAAAANVAYGGTLDGSVIYQNLCGG